MIKGLLLGVGLGAAAMFLLDPRRGKRQRVVDDGVLVDRVRSKIDRVVSHPGAITVMAQNGTVTLTGPVLADEVPHLLSCVKWIAGVQHVNNDLDIHEEAENHPALQSGRERTGEMTHATA